MMHILLNKLQQYNTFSYYQCYHRNPIFTIGNRNSNLTIFIFAIAIVFFSQFRNCNSKQFSQNIARKIDNFTLFLKFWLIHYYYYYYYTPTVFPRIYKLVYTYRIEGRFTGSSIRTAYPGLVFEQFQQHDPKHSIVLKFKQQVIKNVVGCATYIYACCACQYKKTKLLTKILGGTSIQICLVFLYFCSVCSAV
eukprot:TRINITY_DN3978_c2_g1_i1.p3 TRINITY_DN3978_c2_g1~~TRINITY_DN3978_c2_g1_i1.p3  ORF type:complete len:193 (-),score=-7.02 TRINITY_DN3978_c2_g1_i1:842-1420(-)